MNPLKHTNLTHRCSPETGELRLVWEIHRHLAPNLPLCSSSRSLAVALTVSHPLRGLPHHDAPLGTTQENLATSVRSPAPPDGTCHPSTSPHRGFPPTSYSPAPVSPKCAPHTHLSFELHHAKDALPHKGPNPRGCSAVPFSLHPISDTSSHHPNQSATQIQTTSNVTKSIIKFILIAFLAHIRATTAKAVFVHPDCRKLRSSIFG
jgi:hypothetical protein